MAARACRVGCTALQNVSKTFRRMGNNVPATRASASPFSSPAMETATSRAGPVVCSCVRGFLASIRPVSDSSLGRSAFARAVGVPGTASAGSTLAYDEAILEMRAGVAGMERLAGVAAVVLLWMTGVWGVGWAVVLREGVRGTGRAVFWATKSAPPSSHADEEGGGRWAQAHEKWAVAEPALVCCGPGYVAASTRAAGSRMRPKE